MHLETSVEQYPPDGWRSTAQLVRNHLALCVCKHTTNIKTSTDNSTLTVRLLSFWRLAIRAASHSIRMLANLMTCGKNLTWIVFAVCACVLFQAYAGPTVAHETVSAPDQSIEHRAGSHKCDGQPVNPQSPHHRCEHNARLNSGTKIRFPPNSEPDDNTPSINYARPISQFQLASGSPPIGLRSDCMRGSTASRAPFWTKFAQTCSLLN